MPHYLLEALVVVLLILWFLGVFVSDVSGSLIHLLLVAVVGLAVARYALQERRAL